MQPDITAGLPADLYIIIVVGLAAWSAVFFGAGWLFRGIDREQRREDRANAAHRAALGEQLRNQDAEPAPLHVPDQPPGRHCVDDGPTRVINLDEVRQAVADKNSATWLHPNLARYFRDGER